MIRLPSWILRRVDEHHEIVDDKETATRAEAKREDLRRRIAALEAEARSRGSR